MLQLLLLNKDNRHFIKEFLETADQALHHFRYFKTRPLSVLDNHLATYLIKVGDQYVGYGHLDIEEDVVWLGIAISDDFQGMGLGKLMMEALIAAAKVKDLSAIQLAVDSDNKKAIALYHKMNFKTFKETEKVTFMKLSI